MRSREVGIIEARVLEIIFFADFVVSFSLLDLFDARVW
jgi:hypothetical protein